MKAYIYSLERAIPEERWEELGLADPNGRWRSFSQDDTDLVAALERDTRASQELKAVLAEHPELLADLVRHEGVTRFGTRSWPDVLAELLLGEVQDGLGLNTGQFERSTLNIWRQHSRWMSELGVLAPVAALADGYRNGQRRLSSFQRGVAFRTGDVVADHMVDIVSDVVVLHGLVYGRDLEARGVRSQLRRRIESDPDAWLTLLPWVLQASPHSSTVLECTFWAVSAGANPLPVLEQARASTFDSLRLRAEGVAEVFAGPGDLTTELIAKLAQTVDGVRGRRDFPRPLAEPSSTWLSDLGLEAGMRSTIDGTLDTFAEELETQAGAEEEGHVGSLLTRLEERFRVFADARAASTELPQPVEILGAYRRVPKTEEARLGADLAIVISIEVHAQLSLDFADFVQVKKSRRRTGPLDSDRWEIDLDQLQDLLATSSTAVYWLIAGDGSVRVLPAKLLLAVAAGTGVIQQGTFTLRYDQVRHAAVSVSSYLVDLTSGAWLGTVSPDALAVARGESAVTAPRSVFELSIRYSPG